MSTDDNSPRATAPPLLIAECVPVGVYIDQNQHPDNPAVATLPSDDENDAPITFFEPQHIVFSTPQVLSMHVLLFAALCVAVHYIARVIQRSNTSAGSDGAEFLDPMAYVFGNRSTMGPQDAFLYDLGGTSCVCASRWDRAEYWDKVFTGWAFHLPHLSTPMQLQIIVQRWEWVVLWMCLNETVEELQLGLFGRWGFTLDPFQDVEPRYDSLLRDVVLCGLPAVLCGAVFVSVSGIHSFFRAPLRWRWGRVVEPDVWSRFALAVLQVLCLERVNLVYNVSRGAFRFYYGNLMLIFLNIALIWFIFVVNLHAGVHAGTRLDVSAHAHWSAMQVLIWLPSVYPVLDEIYLVYLSVGLILAYLLALRVLQARRATVVHAAWGALALAFCVFACTQPVRYASTVRYTRQGCGLFWGAAGEINGEGCARIERS